jgi:hypothetical protein
VYVVVSKGMYLSTMKKGKEKKVLERGKKRE